jgi:hypothetical protein
VIESARTYLQHGLVPIPVGPDRRPLIRWESFQQEPPHADQVDEWWTRWPDANVGVVTGEVSGIVVLDADGPEGLESLKALRTPATTWLSRTGRGLHQWFAHPGVTVGNRAGVRPHLDVRGDGGYVVAPPSLYASGRRYEWLNSPDRMTLAPLPEHVLALLTAPAAPTAASADQILQGQRNDALYRIARGLVSRGLSVRAVHGAVAEENRARCRPPLPDREVRELVEHALLQPHRPDFRGEPATAAPDPAPNEPTTIEVIDAADLVARTFNEEPALVGGGLIVPGSLNVTSGPPKRGKSLFVLNREIRRAHGHPFLGFATTPGRTLYIQAEIPEPKLKERFVAMLRGEGLDAEGLRDHIKTVTRRGLFLDEPAGYDAIRRLIEQTEPDLLSLDPLARFMTGEENSAREMGRLINALDRLIQAYRIAVELVHHTGKPMHGDPRQGGHRLRGSSALFGAADAVVILDRTQDAWLLSFELRHAEEPAPMPLTRTANLWFSPAGPPEKLVAVASIVKDIRLRFTALVGALVSDMQCSERTAERMVRDAKKAGLIWQGDDGLYRQAVKRRHADGEGSVE